jgi:tRNA uridine 5-carbamoylmethylation protein Kti12
VAAKVSILQVLENFWECAEQNLTREEINIYLLATDYKCRTFYHMAAMMGKEDLLQGLWERSEENLTEDKYDKPLLTADHEGMSAWHVAAKWDNLQVLKKIWEWAENNLTTKEINNLTAEEINNNLLLAIDKKGKNAWHVAAKDGKLEVEGNM